MNRILGSVTLRLAIGYGALVIGAMAMISAVLYFETVGVLSRGIDAKLLITSERLAQRFESEGIDPLARDITALLNDGIDQDTEDYLLLDPKGQKIAGNLEGWDGDVPPFDHLSDRTVMRYDRPSASRVLPHRFADGAVLVVGRDMNDMAEIRRLVVRALAVGGGMTLLLAAGGVFLFHRQLEHRVAAIRRTALEIEAGDLSRRIPVAEGTDEFTRLSRDINHMLDRIQQLMEGVRGVSNAIAHDLRTPLSRIRSLLDEALRPGKRPARLSDAAGAAIRGIDELIVVFDKLLQIAEAESGTRRQSFRAIALREILTDVVELYDASAEARDMALAIDIDGEPMTIGDKDLLRSAAANLIDNALKYAGGSAKIRIRATQEQNTVSIVVEDNGPGIPGEEKAKVITRFYRLDRSRSLPGNGLGLPIVAAISNLHGGTFSLEDAHPGLMARIVLPRADAVALPVGNGPKMARELRPLPGRQAHPDDGRTKARA
jgi:signal transduction histidine kinase